ncbi:hypothetical protein LINPERHAP1_LOCUS4640, partial [Linum perenne]
RTELFLKCYEKEGGGFVNDATRDFVASVKEYQHDPTTDVATSQNDAVSRAYHAWKKKEKSCRVYRGSSSSSGS